MSNKPKPIFSGDLAKPFPRFPEPENFAAALEKLGDSPDRFDEFRRRFQLLLDHYGIAPDDPNLWPRLAIHLMCEHVPGFRIADPEKRGRPSKQEKPETKAARAELLARVEKIKTRRPQLKDSACLKNLKDRGHLPKGLPQAPRSLRRHLDRARAERKIRRGVDWVKRELAKNKHP